MNQKRIKVTILVIFAILFQIANTHYVFSQNIDLLTSDSTVVAHETIDLALVSRKSAERTLKVKDSVAQLFGAKSCGARSWQVVSTHQEPK